MLIENLLGGYDFIRGLGPFSAAVRARTNFAIVHATFAPAIELARGYGLVERRLAAAQRPLAALCGMQLRIPQPLSREGFEQFNRPYIDKLRSWNLEIERANPVTRTNVAPQSPSLAAPALAGFFYTIPAETSRRTWVISGVPEMVLRDGAMQLVAANDLSREGLKTKTESVLDTIDRHLAELGLTWNEPSTANLYTAHDLHALLVSLILPRMNRNNLIWHHARPPVSGLELEIDGWSVLREEIATG